MTARRMFGHVPAGTPRRIIPTNPPPARDRHAISNAPPNRRLPRWLRWLASR